MTEAVEFNCRQGCAACCIAPSISSSTPCHPQGKIAGISCGHLDENLGCQLFGSPRRPVVCSSLQPSLEMCGQNKEDAMSYLIWLEQATKS